MRCKKVQKYFKQRGKVTYFSNIVISFLCTSYLFTGYYVNSDNHDIPKENNEVVEESDEGVSQTGEENKETVTSVVTIKKVNTSNKKYVPASYDAITGNNLVEYAKTYLGLRYVVGGYSLSTGTDCSGFVSLIFKEFGISLSKSLSGQAKSGSYIRYSDLKKGDLVFYGYNDGEIHHVAIYIGDGQVIHESNRRDGVKISSVGMMEYIAARRIITQGIVKSEEKITQEVYTENAYVDSSTDTNNSNKNTYTESTYQEEEKIETNIDVYTQSTYEESSN